MKYFKEVELPAVVNSRNLEVRYTNGVLEVTLRKVKAEKLTGEQTKI